MNRCDCAGSLQVGQELSDRTRKLLASFVGPGSGVRLEAVDRTHTPAHATAVLEQLFSGAGADGAHCSKMLSCA